MDCPSQYSRGRAVAATSGPEATLAAIGRTLDAEPAPSYRTVEALLVQLQQVLASRHIGHAMAAESALRDAGAILAGSGDAGLAALELRRAVDALTAV
jgi:hypothetical protein